MLFQVENVVIVCFFVMLQESSSSSGPRSAITGRCYISTLLILDCAFLLPILAIQATAGPELP